jgi:hypothetical protein
MATATIKAPRGVDTHQIIQPDIASPSIKCAPQKANHVIEIMFKYGTATHDPEKVTCPDCKRR